MEKIKKIFKGYFLGEFRTAFWLTLLFASAIPVYFFLSGQLFSDPVLLLVIIFVGLFYFIDDWLFREKLIKPGYLFILKSCIYLPAIFYFIFITGGFKSALLPSLYLTVITIPLYGTVLQTYLSITLVSLLAVFLYLYTSAVKSINDIYFILLGILSFYTVSGSIKSYVNILEKQKAIIIKDNEGLAAKKKELESQYKEIARSYELQNNNLFKKQSFLEKQQKAVLNILEDIEEEKDKAEQALADLKKFQMAVAGASDHIVITDISGMIIYANKAVERITGFKVPEIIGKKAGTKELWGGLMDKDFYKKLWHTLLENKKPFVGQIKNKRKNGEQYDAAVNISPILDKNNKVIFLLGIERDITREKDVDRAKTEFVSLASHQLRTPLSAINWYVEMLLDEDAGKINSQQKEYLEEVYRGNQRMVELVNALLNVSRLELGTFMIEPEQINIPSVLDNVLKELKVSIKNKNQIIVKEIADNVPKKYKADPKLLHIIFQNLLSNAVKYTPDKGKITVSISKDKNNLLIKIKDSGYGIPKNQQDKIFTKLFRADNVKQMDTEGTGLGLYIIKSIVKRSGGTITFKSQENKGTTFYIKMPLSGMRAKKGNKSIE